MNRRSDAMQIATEVALLGVTVAAIIGMHRLFVDGSFRSPLIFQAVLAHLTMALLRRNRVRLLPAALLSIGIGFVAITLTQYSSTAWLLVPSPETFSAISSDMDAAWQVFRDQQAPATVEPGFVAATSLTVWVIAFVADWGAFRTGVSFEALLPPATLFLFASVLGAEGQRSVGAAVFVGAAMLFLLLHRTWRQEDSASWAALQQHRGRVSLVSTGTVLAGLAVIAGACAGPSLPGAGDDPILPWRDLSNEPQARVVLSPLVDIRGRLVDQPEVQVFTVQTDNGEGYYWRLTALDAFDGQIWKSTYDTEEAEGELPRALPPDTPTEVVRQEFTIQALGQIWLPNAYAAESIDVENDMAVKYDEASGTLIVPADLVTSDELQYTVESAIPAFGDDLRNAPTTIPEEILDRYTKLPGDFSEPVADLARNLTIGGETQYDKALLLQDYLQTFEYTTDIQRGHGKNALERFLLDGENGKRGYCEQFAAAFAAMARSLGIPARVAVGFTQGDEDDNQDGLFRVKGRNAHAWPEVYFEGEGWVLFEPTPGRGPGNTPYLPDIEEEQDEGTEQDPTSPTPDGPTTPTTGAPGPGPGGPTRPEEIGNEGVSVNDPPEEDDSPVRFAAPPVEDVARPAGIGAVAYLLLVPLGLVGQRYLRRARAREPGQKLDLAWFEMNESADAAGIHLLPSLTVAERANRLRLALPGVAPDIDLLAASVERATYAEVPPTEDEVADIAAASAAISAAAAQRRTLRNRIGSYLDVRRLLPTRENARRTAGGPIQGAR